MLLPCLWKWFLFVSWIDSNLLTQHTKPVRLCLKTCFSSLFAHLIASLLFVPAVINCMPFFRCSKLSLASCSLRLECLWLLKPALSLSRFSSVSLLGIHLCPSPNPHPCTLPQHVFTTLYSNHLVIYIYVLWLYAVRFLKAGTLSGLALHSQW